jgi:hypothetical protein
MVKRLTCATAVVLALGLSIFGFRGFGLPGQPEQAAAADANADPSRPEMLKEQIEIAQTALKTLLQLKQQGQVSADSPNFSMWSRRLVEAVRKQGGDKRGLTEALEQHVVLMKSNVEIAKRLFQASASTKEAVLDAQYGLLEAQLSLAEVRGE